MPFPPIDRRRLSRRAAVVIACGTLAAVVPVAGAQPDADLRLSRITLYRSGVGFYELTGKVEGEAAMSLRFDADRINDILKSLVVIDRGGGRVSAAYESNEPLERRLGGFAIDVDKASSLWGLMEQLRGVRVLVEAGDRSLAGSVLGVELREVAEGGSKVSVGFVNVVMPSGVRSIDMRQIDSMRIENDVLAAELDRALATLAEQRGDGSRSVDLRFTGAGVRDVALGYVHEAPVWKTSYRLVLPEGSADKNAVLQGWAIVENTTDDDWENITLSLVSGRPVSFVMDLAQPLYLDRPDVPVPVEVAAAPRAYEGAAAKLGERFIDGGQSPFQSIAENQAPSRASRRLDPAAPAFEAADMFEYAPSAQASAEEIGEVFQYTLDLPVTIERRRSAMLPIVTAPVESRRVSIYSADQPGRHPMRGVEITNTSGLKLMPGPISVYDGGSAYAGDAMIRHIGPGETRLLSYALDLDMTVTPTLDTTERVERVTISNGLLVRRVGRVWTWTLAIVNADAARGRTLILEQANLQGWDFAEGTPDHEITEHTVRFEVGVDPGESREFRVERRRTDETTVQLASVDMPELLRLSRAGAVSDAVMDAVRRAQSLLADVSAARQRVQALEQEHAAIDAEQGRIRENTASIDRSSELYKRYLRKLDEQETRFEQLDREIAAARDDVRSKESTLRAYLDGLNAQ